MSGSSIRLDVTILGCGPSTGVPRADGDWGACDPNEPRNARTRSGMVLRAFHGDTRDDAHATIVLIDTSPDLRAQLLSARVRHIDAVVFTHEHADQTHGLDDVRAIVQTQRSRIATFMDERTAEIIVPRFQYAFEGKSAYPAIFSPPAMITAGQPFTVSGRGPTIAMTPLLQDHGLAPSLGFRVGGFAYSNDLVDMPEETFAALEGLDLWIVDALRYKPHPTHAHLEKTLGWIERLKPKHTVLTNMHGDLDYATLRAQLPAHIEPAYDGWAASIMIDCT